MDDARQEQLGRGTFTRTRDVRRTQDARQDASSEGTIALQAIARTQLEALWGAVHDAPAPELVRRATDLLVPADCDPRGWPSGVSDDHTPFEFSLLVGGPSPELRLMAEPRMTGRADLASTIEAAAAMRPALVELGARFERLDAIADLFLPSDPQGFFAIWYAAAFDREGRPSWKAYLDPAARGRHRASKLLEEALLRLGYDGAWATVTRAMRRGPDLDELRFLSIDLAEGDDARVKIYGFHHEATVDYLCDVAAAVPGARPDHIRAFWKELVGAGDVLRAARQPATCFAFAGGDTTPRTATVHVPIRSIAGDDGSARDRVLRACGAVGVSVDPIESAVRALASRDLESGSGLLAWAGLRTGTTAPKATVYLAPRAVKEDLPHAGARPAPSAESPGAVVRRYEDNSASEHPLFARLAREPADMHRVCVLILNIREAITRDFSRRLASVVARVDEDDLRSVLAKQLDDELGHGDPERTHRLLFETFVEGLAAWAPREGLDRLLEPGRIFGAALEELYTRRSAYEGLGATLVMEVYGKQADLVLASVMRRATEPLPPRVLEWLSLHEALEVDHVDESFALAAMVPAGTKARLTARGAEELGAAGWVFMDGVYRACYGA